MASNKGQAQSAQEVLDALGSNVPPKEPSAFDPAALMALMQQLQAQNLALTERLERAEWEAAQMKADVINRPGENPNMVEDPMFPRQEAKPVPRMLIKRVWIIMEENINIPPNGLQIGVNGYQYLLQPGVRAHVPIGVVGNLRNAIEGKPIVDPKTLKVERYVNVLRYPFRIVKPESSVDPRAPRRADDYEPEDEVA
jgi:hypothetical protein